jgi:hypothetical protein
MNVTLDMRTHALAAMEFCAILAAAEKVVDAGDRLPMRSSGLRSSGLL